MGDKDIFKPRLAEDEKLGPVYKPLRRANAIGYAINAVVTVAALGTAYAYSPELIDVCRDLYEAIGHPPVQTTLMEGVKATASATGAIVGLCTGLSWIGMELNLLSYRFALTTERIMIKSGLLRRDVKNIRYRRITDTSVEQSLAGRLTNTGSIYISTAGQDGYEGVIWGVKNPVRVEKAINTKSKRAGRDQALDDLVDPDRSRG